LLAHSLLKRDSALGSFDLETKIDKKNLDLLEGILPTKVLKNSQSFNALPSSDLQAIKDIPKEEEKGLSGL
jgi:hypothetical protein